PEEQWVQRTSGAVGTEDQWNSGYRGLKELWAQRTSGTVGKKGPEEQWAQRTSGTVGTENQWNSGTRGTVGKEDQIGIVIGIACFSWNRAYSLTILVRQESYLLPRGHPENSFLLESPSFNAKRGIMVPGVPCVSRGK
ncbi:unnamed protein product, partial [Pocillopora meandrina]